MVDIPGSPFRRSEVPTRPDHEGGEVLDWILIGGGPHAVCAARALVVAGASVRIVEPSGRLLDRWTARATTVAMTWMRSPIIDHVDAGPTSLHHFLHRPEHADVAEQAGPFRRPTHEAFLRHTRDVIEVHGLDACVVPGRVDAMHREGSHLRVEGEGLALRARRVLVATGSNTPRVPFWAQALIQDGAPIRHVFGPDLAQDLDVVGGGISAVQRALHLQKATQRPVRLWMRHRVREADFDFDRAWTKHRFVADWTRKSIDRRAAFLASHPDRGSVPKGLAARLDQAVRRGSIQVEHEVPAVTWSSAREELELRSAAGMVASTGLTLATGHEPEVLPAWLRTTATELGLPVHDGLPVLDDTMQWGHGVHVSGPLARLALGPMAANLVGARWATSKLPSVKMLPS